MAITLYSPYVAHFVTNKRILTLLFPIGGLILLVAYYFLDPEAYAWIPKCPLHTLTGWDCPGCGSQRMIHALLHGDIASAFRANALLLCLLPALVLLGYVEVFQTRLPKLYAKLHHPRILVSMAVLIIAWGVARNFL